MGAAEGATSKDGESNDGGRGENHFKKILVVHFSRDWLQHSGVYKRYDLLLVFCST